MVNIDVVKDKYKFGICGVIYLCITLLDYWTYVSHPTQANIFVEDSQKMNRYDKEVFDLMNIEADRAEAVKGSKTNVFELERKYTGRGERPISFLNSVVVPELLLIGIAGGIRLAAWRIC